MTTTHTEPFIAGESQMSVPPRGLSPTGAPFFAKPVQEMNPADFVDVGGEPYTSPTPHYVSHPVQPRQLPDPLPPKVARAYSALMTSRCDLISYGWRDALTGEKWQISEAKLNRHFAATFWKRWAGMDFVGPAANTADILKPLSAKRIRNAGAGRETLYLHSAWQQPKGKSGEPAIQRVLVRFDLDCHECPAADIPVQAEAAKAWLISVLSNVVTPFWCGSEHGASGYIWLSIPNGPNYRTGEIHATMSRADVNEKLLALHQSIDRLAHVAGIQAKIEVLGGYVLTTEQERDPEMGDMPCSPKRVEEKALDGRWMAKAPVVRTLDDVRVLKAAEVSIAHPVWDRLITAAAGFPDRPPYESEADKRVNTILATCGDESEEQNNEQAAPRGKGGKHKPISEPTSKPSGRAKAIGLAIHELGIRGRDVLMGRREEIIECGMRIYADRGWGDNVNDTKRVKDFGAAFDYVAKHFDAQQIGKTKGARSHWFTDHLDHPSDNHVNVVMSKLGMLISQEEIDEANAQAGTKTKQKPVDLKTLAVTLLFIRKDTLAPKPKKYAHHKANTCGTSAIVNACNSKKRFNLGVSGTTVRIALGLLCRKGLITCTSIADPERHISRGWDATAVLFWIDDDISQIAHAKGRIQIRAALQPMHDGLPGDCPSGAAGGHASFFPIIRYKDEIPADEEFGFVFLGAEWMEVSDFSPEIEENRIFA